MLGVGHADDLQYLFPLGKDLFISAAPTKTDIKIRNVITEMWVNFAKTGLVLLFKYILYFTRLCYSLPKWNEIIK